MTPATNRVRWTSADLDLLPDDDRRYEIIAGELIITGAQGWGIAAIPATGRQRSLERLPPPSGWWLGDGLEVSDDGLAVFPGYIAQTVANQIVSSMNSSPF